MSSEEKFARPYEWEFVQAIDTCRKLYIRSSLDPLYANAFLDSVKILWALLPPNLREKVPLPEIYVPRNKSYIEKGVEALRKMRREGFKTLTRIIDVALKAGLITEVKGIILPVAEETSQEYIERHGPAGFPEYLSVEIKGDEEE